MVSFSRYPRMLVFFAGLTVALAVVCDFSHDAGGEMQARALLVYTLLSLGITCVFMCCRLFVDAKGVGVGAVFYRHHTRWEDIAAIGYLRCNGRRAYLYGLDNRYTSFERLLLRAPRCGSGRFIVPDSRKLRIALGRYCPFSIENVFGRQERLGGTQARTWMGPMLWATLLCAGGVLAAGTGLSIGRFVCTTALEPAGLLLWCILSAGCLCGGAFLLVQGGNTLFYAPVVSEQGIRIGSARHGLALPWASVAEVWRVKAQGRGSVYLFNMPSPTTRREGQTAEAAGPVRKPMDCLSLTETHLLALAMRTYCPKAARRVYDRKGGRRWR